MSNSYALNSCQLPEAASGVLGA